MILIKILQNIKNNYKIYLFLSAVVIILALILTVVYYKLKLDNAALNILQAEENTALCKSENRQLLIKQKDNEAIYLVTLESLTKCKNSSGMACSELTSSYVNKLKACEIKVDEVIKAWKKCEKEENYNETDCSGIVYDIMEPFLFK